MESVRGLIRKTIFPYQSAEICVRASPPGRCGPNLIRVAVAQFGSAARDRVDILNRARQRQRRPDLPAILGAEHLALIASSNINLSGVGWMQGYRHDRSV